MNISGPARSPLARRLREARAAKGISQKGLGILIGIDPSSASPRINQYESGKHLPDFKIAKLLAESLEVSVTYFYAEDDGLARLILAYNALSVRKQSKVLKAVEDPSIW